MEKIITNLAELPKSLVLYHCDTSYASQKVRLYMAQMNIVYVSQHVDLRKQEHILSAYREINPKGQVPTLVDNTQAKAQIVCGSTDIMLYLNDHFCAVEHKLPEDLRQAVTKFCLAHEALHDPSLRTLSYHYLFISKQLSPEETKRLVAVAQQHPNAARGEFLKRAVLHEFTEEELTQAEQEIEKALIEMERLLVDCSQLKPCFMFGEQYTMADAVATASVFRILKIMPDKFVEYPQVKIYYEIMQSLPSFSKAELK